MFEDARNATEELFANDEQTVIPEEEQPVETVETPTEDTEATEQVQEPPAEDNTVLDEAVDTAEIAAQAAQEKDMQLQQALQDIEALRAQNEQMQGTIEELSKKNEENLIEEAMQMPIIDLDALAFATEEEKTQALSEYAQKMSEYVKGGVMKEISPFVEQAKEGIYQKEKADALSALSAVPELAGINDMLPQLDRIIAANKWLQSEDMPMDEKYINAYAIAMGVNAINTPPEEPKELTSEELMDLYDKNPTFQELVEKKRLETIKQSQQVPPFSASSGAVNAALNIQDKPKTFEEAAERTRQLFGLN